MKATRSKARQDVVNAAKKMPPLFISCLMKISTIENHARFGGS